MSKYTAEFTSIINKNYLIEIETEKGSKTGTFKLSGNPLTSSMNSDGKTLYSPIKTTGITISILTDAMPFDLYSGSAMGTKINVKEDGNYIFKGFLTPCAYSMGFDSEIEEIQLECVDGISVLSEIPYSSNDKEIKPFINILFNCLKKANCFKTLYITNSLQLTSSGNDSIFEKIRVSEGNFFEEKDYELQPDNEVAMSCYDVLFEIMQYLGCTLIAEGEDVYILDYDSIRNNKNSYFKYDISGSNLGTRQSTTLTQTFKIKEGCYASSGNKVDLSEVFNKITVKDDFYKIETVNDGMDSNNINITSSDDVDLRNAIGKTDDGVYVYVDVLAPDNDRMEVLTTRTNPKDGGWYYWNIFRFFKNPMIQTYHYNLSTNAKMTNSYFDDNMNYYRMWNSKGANVVGVFTQFFNVLELYSWGSTYTKDKWATMTDIQKLNAYAELLKVRDVKNKKLTNYIVCNNPKEGHITYDKVKNYPYFTIKKNVSSLFGGVNGFIVIKGSIIRHPWTHAFHTFLTETVKDIKEQNCTVYKNESYVWARLKWGNQYWKEEGDSPTIKGEWTSTPSYFKLYYGDPTKEVKLIDYTAKELPIYNTCNTIWGETGEEGYYIPVPTDENLAGEIELTIFANRDTKGKQDRRGKADKKNSYDGYPPYVMMYKDLEIKLGFADDTLNEDAAQEDTYYTNEVEDYLNVIEGDDVNCKICTYDTKTPSYSTTDYLDASGKSQYIDQLWHIAYNLAMRAEEHIIFKTINQYQEPKIIYTANLKNNLDLKPYALLTNDLLSGSFIIDTIQRDYKYNKAEVSLIEKNKTYK